MIDCVVICFRLPWLGKGKERLANDIIFVITKEKRGESAGEILKEIIIKFNMI